MKFCDLCSIVQLSFLQQAVSQPRLLTVVYVAAKPLSIIYTTLKENIRGFLSMVLSMLLLLLCVTVLVVCVVLCSVCVFLLVLLLLFCFVVVFGVFFLMHGCLLFCLFACLNVRCLFVCLFIAGRENGNIPFKRVVHEGIFFANLIQSFSSKEHRNVLFRRQLFFPLTPSRLTAL